MKKLQYAVFSLAVCAAFNNVFAEQSTLDVQWRGDASSSLQFLVHSRSSNSNLGGGIEDAILHAEIKDTEVKPLKAVVGVGVLEHFNYEGALSPYSPIDVGLHYGWMEYQSPSGLLWQLGQIDNKAGLERGISTHNSQIQFGSINQSRSFYYPGLRAVYNAAPMQLYAELIGPETPDDTGLALGTQIDNGNSQLGVKFTRYVDSEDTHIDLSWSQDIAMLSLGGVLDYIQLSNTPVWQDDTALAIAGYLKWHLQKKYIALRGEYFDAGNTGIYSFEKAGVITATYGVELGKSAFIRFEGVYAKSNKKVFRDDRVPVKDQYGVAMQIGMRFKKG